MKKNNIVRPNDLKGNDKLNRMRELMGESVKETRKNSVIELTKKGPDGKIYGIVRENHDYYIKIVGTDNKTNLVAEDFSYIGGLQNKKQEAYPTYAKAIKQLNLKFLSLNESFGGEKINVFEDDNLQEGAAFGFGFANEVEDNNGNDAKTDNETSGDNLDGDFDENPSASSTNTGKHNAGEKGHDDHIIGEDVELTEDEEAIDRMVEGLDAVGDEDSDIDNDGDSDDADDYLKNKRLKIGKAIDIEENEDKMDAFIESLSPAQAQALVEALKKKV